MLKIKTLLSAKLNETQDRSMFTAEEVRDSLLDLWLALDESDGNTETAEPEPASV